MYEVIYYRDRNGNAPVEEYVNELAQRKDKESRIKLNKFYEYVKALSEYGLLLREPYIKPIDGDIWELRPINDRIFFVAWNGGRFVLLHHFTKKSRKTPTKEIAKAKRELADLKRSMDDEQQH